MAFYHYNQNNSGGDFVVDMERGISCHVIIEAENAEHADRLAEDVGLYFDGYGDCSCCGDRWHEAGSRDRSDEPEIYGEPIDVHYSKPPKYFSWTDDNQYDAFVHYLDGTMKGYQYPKVSK